MDPLNDSETCTQNLNREGGRGQMFDDGRKGDWMQTYTGKRFYPEDPRGEDVDIIDIALALGNVSRYLGHCRFYSVAEHSVMVSHVVSAHFALEGLLHDAEEAYVHDFIRPWKRALSSENQYFTLAHEIGRVVRVRFGLPEVESPEVKQADVAVLGAEKQVLHPRSDPWYLPYHDPGLKIRCLLPVEATKSFLRRYAELADSSIDLLLRRVDKILNDDEARLRAHWGLR